MQTQNRNPLAWQMVRPRLGHPWDLGPFCQRTDALRRPVRMTSFRSCSGGRRGAVEEGATGLSLGDLAIPGRPLR
jgi:hypothetical protein